MNIPWYSHGRLPLFVNLFNILKDFSCEIPSMDTENLKSIRNHLYSSCFANMKSYAEALPGESDAYQSMPIIHLYSVIADINYTLFHRWFRSEARDSEELDRVVFYDKTPPEIPFCRDNNLLTSRDITINNFNISELLMSMDSLEIKMTTVGYSTDLFFYLEALELRVNEFILFTNSADSHNVSNLRIKHPTQDIYACTTYCEYILCIRILAMKRDLQGAMDHLRDHAECVRPVFEEEIEKVQIIYNNLLDVLQHVHTDNLQDDFSETYEENSVRSSVGYQFLKENKYSDTPEPVGTITQFDGDAYWKNVCVQSNMDLDEQFYSMENYVAFYIAFFQVTELAIMAHTENNWTHSKAPEATGNYVSDYFITNNTLKILTSNELDSLHIRSNASPLFLQCFNDAGILFQEKLYIFGNTPIDYLRAFHSWIDIIENCFNGNFLNKIPIYNLRAKVLNPDTKPNIQKYIDNKLKGHENKFTQSLPRSLIQQRDARISLLSTTQTSHELSAATMQRVDEPFLADANSSIWF